MLEYDRIDVSKGIDINKTSSLPKCIICCYYYYCLKVNFKFIREVCDCSHDMTQKLMSFDDIPIATVKRNDYRIHF